MLKGRIIAPALVLVLASCATDAPRAAGAIARGEPAPGPQRVTAASMPVSTDPATRPVRVLEDMTATVRQWTIFGSKPTRADLDADLAKRAAELNADAVVNVRYGDQGAGAISWSQISGTGQAIRYE